MLPEISVALKGDECTVKHKPESRYHPLVDLDAAGPLLTAAVQRAFHRVLAAVVKLGRDATPQTTPAALLGAVLDVLNFSIDANDELVLVELGTIPWLFELTASAPFSEVAWLSLRL